MRYIKNIIISILLLVCFHLGAFRSSAVMFFPGSKDESIKMSCQTGKAFAPFSTYIIYDTDDIHNAICLNDGFFVVSCYKESDLSKGKIYYKGKFRQVKKSIQKYKYILGERSFYFSAVSINSDVKIEGYDCISNLEKAPTVELDNKEKMIPFYLAGKHGRRNIIAGRQGVIKSDDQTFTSVSLKSANSDISPAVKLEIGNLFCNNNAYTLATCSTAVILNTNLNCVVPLLIGVGLTGLEKNNESLFLKISALKGLIAQAKKELTMPSLSNNVINDKENIVVGHTLLSSRFEEAIIINKKNNLIAQNPQKMVVVKVDTFLPEFVDEEEKALKLSKAKILKQKKKNNNILDNEDDMISSSTNEEDDSSEFLSDENDGVESSPMVDASDDLE